MTGWQWVGVGGLVVIATGIFGVVGYHDREAFLVMLGSCVFVAVLSLCILLAVGWVP